MCLQFGCNANLQQKQDVPALKDYRNIALIFMKTFEKLVLKQLRRLVTAQYQDSIQFAY